MSTQTDTQTGYSLVVKATQDAIKADQTSEGKWVHCAKHVASFFGTESALEGVKAQFIADAILPAIDKRHAQALATELPRKGSKEYNELTDSGKTLWEDKNQAKKDARSTCDIAFKRVLKYAFPKAKDENTESTVTDETKDLEVLNSLIKRLEKAQSRSYSITTVMTSLLQARIDMAKQV
jgi:hypothetical protein